MLLKEEKVATYTVHHRIGVQWLKDNVWTATHRQG